MTNHWGPLTGQAFESAVVAEVIKQVRNTGVESRCFHLRTHDGREVDLLVELDSGSLAIQFKQTRRAVDADARPLRGLEEFVDRPLLAALLVTQDPHLRELAGGVRAVPAAWLLGPGEQSP